MVFDTMIDLVVRREGWPGFVRPSNLRYAPSYGAAWVSSELFVASTNAGTVLVVWVEGPGMWLTAKGVLHTFRLGTRQGNHAAPLGLTDSVLSRLLDTERVIGVGVRDLQGVAEQGPQKLVELRLKGEI
ncbi:MAG: hypothetical protein Q9M13_07860 [Mariprofundales bacterium]|nr:hypothetical protein [Mariprofundales bacterium]